MTLVSEQVNATKSDIRIPSGVIGLDPLIGGGFRPNSVNVIMADPGCGKSTMCWLFSSADTNVPTLYLSLEQDIDSVINESGSIGIDGFSKKKSNGTLHFVYAFSEQNRVRSGRVAHDFLMEELPKYIDFFMKISAKYPNGMRIVIDPITPLLFELDGIMEQRDVLNRIFQSLRKIGTVIVTLEKGFDNQLTKVPQYLADSIFELDFVGLGSSINRTLRIKKFRGSKHSEKPHPIEFVKGKGLVVHTL
jgi:circadian clock protein KaiC